jgi:hypothetical protein
LHYFGVMAAVSLVMHLFFVQKSKNKNSQIASYQSQL